MKNKTPTQMNNLPVLTRLSFYVGAPLLFVATMVWLSGLGAFDTVIGSYSYIEGIIGGIAVVLMIPGFLIIGDRIAEDHRVLGGFVAVVGLLGCIGGFMAMVVHRTMTYELIQFGFELSLVEDFWTQFYGYTLGFMTLGPLFPLAHILVGISLWRMSFITKWIPVFLIIGGVLFPIAQIGSVMFLWPISVGLLAIAYPYLGYLLYGNKPN